MCASPTLLRRGGQPYPHTGLETPCQCQARTAHPLCQPPAQSVWCHDGQGEGVQFLPPVTCPCGCDSQGKSTSQSPNQGGWETLCGEVAKSAGSWF